MRILSEGATCIAERSILADPNRNTKTRGTFIFKLKVFIFHVSPACDVNFLLTSERHLILWRTTGLDRPRRRRRRVRPTGIAASRDPQLSTSHDETRAAPRVFHPWTHVPGTRSHASLPRHGTWTGWRRGCRCRTCCRRVGTERYGSPTLVLLPVSLFWIVCFTAVSLIVFPRGPRVLMTRMCLILYSCH